MSTVTVAAVLFGDQDPATAVAASPGWRGVLDGLGGAWGSVTSTGRQVAERELAKACAGLLGLDVRDVLVGGWRTYRALMAAAHATKDHPGAIEVVQLASHRITTSHRPYVDIAVNGATVATVHMELSLVVDVDSLLGTVQRARLTTLESGRCTVTASLGCEGHALASRQVMIDPVLTVPLGKDGLALL